MKLLGLILVPLILATSPLPDWAKAARRLTGSGQAGRVSALKKLKEIPEIETTLKEGLEGEERFLALDAVVALKLESLFSDVLRVSQRDRSGFFYLALDALVESAQEPELAQIYRERLLDRSTSAAAKVVILDSLIRLRARIHPDLLDELLTEETPEVQSAALYYLRGFLITYRENDQLLLLKKVLEGKLSRQRRIQALALVSELSAGDVHTLIPVTMSCSGDLPTALEALCAKLQAR